MALLWFILFWVLLVVAIMAWPTWPHAGTRGWGDGPSGAAAALPIVLLLLF